MPAIPAVIMGGAALGSALIGKKASDNAAKAASQRSPEELALMEAQTGLAKQQGAQGAQMFGTAMPAVSNTLRYYQTLLGGGRGARVAATSPEAESTGEAYQGADLALQRSGARGGELVAQRAENSRAKAGQISRLITGARPAAAAASGNLAGGLVGAAQGAESAAAGNYANLTGNSTQNRQQGNFIGMQTGANLTGNLGKLFANVYNASRSGGGGGQSLVSSRSPGGYGPGPSATSWDDGDM